MSLDQFGLKVKAVDVRLHFDEYIDWGIESLGVPDLWRLTEGEDVKVAVLDTGIDSWHPDLHDAIDDVVDFTNSMVGPFDRLGHGTHVAGIIGARLNRFGIIGVAPKVRLLSAKVIDDYGNGNIDQLVKGIEWAIDKGVDVINLSLGTPTPHPRMEEAVRFAAGKNIILVAAAGNYASYYLDTINYPAKYEHTISVGSVNKYFLRSNYSAMGGQLDIMAPGEEIYSCHPLGMYAKLSGTSMATPFVSGVVALCLAKHQKYPSDTPCNNFLLMREHLRKTATDLGEIGPDRFYGYGLINPPDILK